MAALTAVCFGGPLNDQVISTEYRTFEVVLSEPIHHLLSEPPDMMIPERRGLYRWQRFGWSWDQDRWAGGCWVYDGFPMDRIEVGLMVSSFLPRLLALAWV